MYRDSTTIDTSDRSPLDGLLPTPHGSQTHCVVLDTNVVLDWLLFHDSAVDALATAVVHGQFRWITTACMRNEFAYVLSHGDWARWAPQPEAIWGAWERHAVTLDPQRPLGGAARLRCTDADDQPFVDLALCSGASRLYSRDRAVLKLARRARPYGLHIMQPGREPLDAAPAGSQTPSA